MKAAECISLSIKIGGVQNLVNEVLINPYKLGYKSSNVRKLSSLENLRIKRQIFRGTWPQIIYMVGGHI